MCGRYALAGYDADELVEQLIRQLASAEATAEHDPPAREDEEPPSDQPQTTQESPTEAATAYSSASAPGGSRLTSSPPAAARGDGALSGADGSRVRWLNEVVKDTYRPRYNVAPRSKAVVARLDPASPDESSVILETMEWGIIPSYSKKMPFNRPINARDDTVRGGEGLWAGLRSKKRCVVIAEGFFEWLARGKDKIPHYTKPRDGGLMIMAGLWDTASFEGLDAAGGSTHTFAVVTTSSNRQLRFLHDRMPVILSTPEEIMLWLSPAPWLKSVDRLMRPLDKPLECYQVPQEAGNVRRDFPELVQPIADRKGSIESIFAQQAASPPRKPANLPDLSQPAMKLTSPARTAPTPKSAPTSVKKEPKQAQGGSSPATPERKKKPMKIDSFFKKQPPTPKAKGEKKKKTKVKVEHDGDDSSDLEVIEPETRAKRRKVKDEQVEEGVEVLVVEEDEEGVKVESKGVQEEVNPA